MLFLPLTSQLHTGLTIGSRCQLIQPVKTIHSKVSILAKYTSQTCAVTQYFGANGLLSLNVSVAHIYPLSLVTTSYCFYCPNPSHSLRCVCLHV